jgi:hypothetical protein
MIWVKQPDDKKPITRKQARQKFQKAMSDLLAGKNPGSISFRLKPSRKASETYPLKLTQQQRESLIHCTRLKRGLKSKLEDAGEGTQTVGVTRKELNELYEESGQAAYYALSPHKKRLVAAQQKAAKFFEEEHAGVFSLETPKTSKRPSSTSDLLFQFKITLVGTKPPIWRRIQVQDCTLGDLHEVIQVAMGWEDCHMHQFIIGGERYGTPLPDDFNLAVKSEKKLRLSQIVAKSGNKVRFRYEYDLDDVWLHEIAFEEFPDPEAKAKYPRCVAGTRSGPPEDIGGIGGYEEYLEAIADPKHERHDEFMEWNGGWDAEKFSVESVNKALRGFSRR